MTPPEAKEAKAGAGATNAHPAPVVRVEGMKTRPDFLAAARGRRVVRPGFILQARYRNDGQGATRVGYTCSKKVGGSVHRNRAKRRLREIARRIVPELGHPGWDYVLIGRAKTTATLPFQSLTGDLANALAQIHGQTP